MRTKQTCRVFSFTIMFFSVCLLRHCTLHSMNDCQMCLLGNTYTMLDGDRTIAPHSHFDSYQLEPTFQSSDKLIQLETGYWFQFHGYQPSVDLDRVHQHLLH